MNAMKEPPHSGRSSAARNTTAPCIDKWRRIYRDDPEWRQTAKGGLFSRESDSPCG